MSCPEQPVTPDPRYLEAPLSYTGTCTHMVHIHTDIETHRHTNNVYQHKKNKICLLELLENVNAFSPKTKLPKIRKD